MPVTEKYTGPRDFKARNYCVKAKAAAESAARQLTAESGTRYGVTYFDDYNDYSVSGTYQVRPV